MKNYGTTLILCTKQVSQGIWGAGSVWQLYKGHTGLYFVKTDEIITEKCVVTYLLINQGHFLPSFLKNPKVIPQF